MTHERLTQQALKVFLTGASGFLGSEVAKKMLQAGFQVTLSDISPPDNSKGYEICRCDILDPQSLLNDISGHDVVVHCAGLAHIFDPFRAKTAPYQLVNEIGTRNVVWAAVHSRVEHIIYVSSVSVYGGPRLGEPDESFQCVPTTEYSRSKLAGERIAIQLVAGKPTRLTILRMATIYGEGDPGNLRRLITQIDVGRFFWVGLGSNRKSLIHISDAGRACLAALERRGEKVAVFNVTAPSVTMKEIVSCIYHILGKRPPRGHLPGPLVLRVVSLLARISPVFRARLVAFSSDLSKWLADDAYFGEKLQRETGFQSRVTLIDGLRREIEWLKTRCP